MATPTSPPKHPADPYVRRLDSRVRSQDDFFGYVNGRWLREHPIPPSESSWGVFSMLRDEAWRHLRDIYEDLEHRTGLGKGTIEQQARDLYYTAMHVDDFETVHLQLIAAQFKKIDAITNVHELAACLGELHAGGVDAVWGIVVDTDDKDSARHILRLQQAGLTLPDRDYYYLQTAAMKRVRVQLVAHMAKVQKALAGLPDDPAFSDVVTNFELELANHSRSSAALREVEQNYHQTSYAKLCHDYPNIDWPAYAAALGWRPDDKISVDQPEFFAFINQQFVAPRLPVWRAYLKWHVALAYYGRISERFADLRFEFFGRVLSGTKAILPQWKRAVLALDYLIGPGVGRLYAERYFPETSKRQVLKLVEAVRTAYRHRIERLDWMSAGTKRRALKKLANTKVLIGYPDEWRDFSALAIGRESFIANAISAEKFQTAYYMRRLHEPTSRSDWLMDPQTVNAYSDPARLVICFPAAILQAPFFDAQAPAAINFGGIGTVIGHELTHGFDDQGYKFDEHGNVRVWQTPTDRAQFAKRARVLIDHANTFEVLPGLKLKGELVAGESIADLGGIEIAYEAFMSLPASGRQFSGSMTAEQLFFIAYATTECMAVRDAKKREYTLSDPHPDSRFRVNGILAHADCFYQTFNLTQTDALHRPPAKRARIW